MMATPASGSLATDEAVVKKIARSALAYHTISGICPRWQGRGLCSLVPAGGVCGVGNRI
jgi:hypothetical protein